MVSLCGRGFDSRQLHLRKIYDQAENNHPRQGVFVFWDTSMSLLI